MPWGRRVLILYFGVSAAIYFVSAGRTNLPLAWAYFGINFGTGVIFSIVLEILNPGLIAERFKPGAGVQHRVFKIGSSILTVLMLVVTGSMCWPVPLDRSGGPVVADRRAGLGGVGISVHAVGHADQPVLFFSGAVADRSRSGGGRLRAVPIGTADTRELSVSRIRAASRSARGWLL